MSTAPKCGLVIQVASGDMHLTMPLPPGVEPKPTYKYRGREWRFIAVVRDDTPQTDRASAQEHRA